MMHNYDGAHFLGMHLYGWLFWVLVVAVVVGVFGTVRRRRGRGTDQM
ncbi:MAG: hypothetical protein ABI877_15455 [Gemmatimonadaceae bacterium]